MPNLSLLILEGKRFILIRRTDQNYFFTWMKIRKKSFNQNNIHFSQFYIDVEFKFVFQFLKGSPCIILLYLSSYKYVKIFAQNQKSTIQYTKRNNICAVQVIQILNTRNFPLFFANISQATNMCKQIILPSLLFIYSIHTYDILNKCTI